MKKKEIRRIALLAELAEASHHLLTAIINHAENEDNLDYGSAKSIMLDAHRQFIQPNRKLMHCRLKQILLRNQTHADT